MTIEEALDIIQHDPDYMDIRKWTKKHYDAQDLYWKYSGIPYKMRKKLKKDIKDTLKVFKMRKKYGEKALLRSGSD
ncbi:MAG: hypothetical protein IKU67_05640 [Firmicutes bacterium]|nr:hypothetical protein [Bacillota bacterium]